MGNAVTFDLNCQKCPRICRYLDDCRQRYPDYHGRPVAPFGDAHPRLLIVGLAPGYHGANATGRPFTGDYAGLLLYNTLYKFGYSTHAQSTAVTDGLRLIGARITNAVKCAPPENKPTGGEIAACNDFLKSEIAALPTARVILALGRVAHHAVLRALDLPAKQYGFGHHLHYAVDDSRWLVSSYHCSRYNTQTGRLTAEMFEQVFATIKTLDCR